MFQINFKRNILGRIIPIDVDVRKTLINKSKISKWHNLKIFISVLFCLSKIVFAGSISIRSMWIFLSGNRFGKIINNYWFVFSFRLLLLCKNLYNLKENITEEFENVNYWSSVFNLVSKLKVSESKRYFSFKVSKITWNIDIECWTMKSVLAFFPHSNKNKSERKYQNEGLSLRTRSLIIRNEKNLIDNFARYSFFFFLHFFFFLQFLFFFSFSSPDQTLTYFFYNKKQKQKI